MRSDGIVYGAVEFGGAREDDVSRVLVGFESARAAEQYARANHIGDYRVAPIEFPALGKIPGANSGPQAKPSELAIPTQPVPSVTDSGLRPICGEPASSLRIARYFAGLCDEFQAGGHASIAVTHLLPDRPFFLNALAAATDLRAVLAKPRSVDEGTWTKVAATFRCDRLDRGWFASGPRVLEYLEECAFGEPLILLDIGGYFAASLEFLCANFSGQIVGVVEDTENGHQRYAGAGRLPCPVYSVARSPLKLAEDYLVGQSIVFSTEALLRAHGDIMHGRQACVVGYGKIGRSVAAALRARSIRTTVYETDESRSIEALAHGFPVGRTKAEALTDAGVVICATGNHSLAAGDVRLLQEGAYVGTVTSSDDELDLASIRAVYDGEDLGPHLTRMATPGHHFYLLNDGNAVNFVHGAAVGPFIYLVQGEILAAASSLARGDAPPGLHEVDSSERMIVAQTWLREFNPI